MLIWAVAFGSMSATFPFSVLYSKFGARYVFFAAGIISATSTLLIPLATKFGIYYLLTLRVCQGIAYAADFAAIGVLCSRWASLKQNGVFISFLTCFTPFSSSITNPVAGALCESRFGWPAVFYSHGTVSVLLFILWFIIYTDNPATHRAVSNVELEKIHRNKSAAHINMEPFTPYRQILKNPVVWVVWLNALADIGSTIFLITYTPTYINNVLHYSVSKTGILGALPAILNIPFKLGSGYLSDSLK
uniref:Major facilitator superfamily (MFS) profile domain-containing protein n=1 Tax=Panagrolaimus sp. ES5 TaxID=591445 RepID=A0AC34FPS5_9BILA